MAKVYNNIITQGLTGKLGNQIVFRNDKAGRTIVSLKPNHLNERVYNAAQLEHQEAFRQATTYAKFAKDQPIYVEKAKGTPMTAYNVAVADWFGSPEVLAIETDGWTGEIGQTILITAKDNVWVASVGVVITDQNGTQIEEGQAVHEDGLRWVYTTTAAAAMQPTPKIIAWAKDLAGNTDGLEWPHS